MKTKTHAKTLVMVQLALLSALVIVLQLFFSSIRVGAVTLNFALVPIVIAGIFISPLAGLYIGTLAGITTFIQVFTSGDVFYVFLMTNSPIATALICIVKTAAAGLIAGLVYRILKNCTKHTTVNTIIVSVICPVINTALFVLGMFVFFGDALAADAIFAPLVQASSNVFAYIIVGLVGINFFVELALNVIVCPIVAKALFSSKLFKNN